MFGDFSNSWRSWIKLEQSGEKLPKYGIFWPEIFATALYCSVLRNQK